MIFQDGHSSLVRLSDSIKCTVMHVNETSERVIAYHRKHSAALKVMRQLARELKRKNDFSEASMKKLQEASQAIPDEDAEVVVFLQTKLNTEVLQVILMCCFTLESYINSLGFHLLKERDLLGLLGNSGEAICETLLTAIDRMKTTEKWQTIGSLKNSDGFSNSEPPFQDLKILFNYRNDHVHDKVVEWKEKEDRAKKRYNNKLPDSFGELLEPKHALYACDTYWTMVQTVHQLVGLPMKDFHRHYNLSPWFDDEFERQTRKLAREYSEMLQD